ncbi:hypothetical protein BSKO_11350 [Bryopsis sp. KO-2023]|nr:hypothetical protein BSKO_11350 [Bryopsis sp. KO-2023]
MLSSTASSGTHTATKTSGIPLVQGKHPSRRPICAKTSSRVNTSGRNASKTGDDVGEEATANGSKRRVAEVSFKRAVLDLVKLKKDVQELEVEGEVVEKARTLGEAMAFAEWFRTLAFVLASADLLPVLNELWGGTEEGKMVMSAVVGGSVGLGFALFNSIAQRRLWSSPKKSLNVVITGSTRGIGKALAREFLKTGDKVFITASSGKGVQEALTCFRSDLQRWGMNANMVVGTECDVSSPAGIARLTSLAKGQMGQVDVWVNCAGYSGSFQDFTDISYPSIAQVVNTNLLGSILCTRNAIKLMETQAEGGHIFNTEGAGSDFSATPKYAAYGATKAAITQFTLSVQSELKERNPAIGIHTVQPGMVLTKLLLEGATVENKQFFNILCEQPETVAAFLVPRMRTVVARKQKRAKVTYLTMARALERLLTAPSRFGRFFDEQGTRVYPSEEDRIYGSFSKVTARLADNARDRTKHLATLYSICMAISFFLMETRV